MLNKKNGMSHNALSDFVEATATKLGIPGVSVGVWANGQEIYACHGITSIDNPLPVDKDTMYVIGSVSKTFTATAMMRLVAEGRVDLNAPVRQYVPELQLADEKTAAEITVLNLLNHTTGLDWGLIFDTGDGADALAVYEAKMSELKIISPPNARASYSQAGYNLAGRIIEKVTGLTFDKAIASLVFQPLRLSHSFFNRDDIMTRRFAVGHNPSDDGALSVARLWRRWNGDNPGGGIVSSVSDLIRWARFHLGNGFTGSENCVLSPELLNQMKEPTVQLRGSVLGDAIGICWFLRDIDGVQTVGHGGSANGQFADLLIVPERNFAVVALSNSYPNGIPFNKALIRWALENYLGVIDRDQEPLPYDEKRSLEVVGSYETDAQTLTISTSEELLTLEVNIKLEIRAAAEKELPPDYPPADIGFLPGNGEEYIITNGGLKGQRGFFTRNKNGEVVGVDLAGRLYRKTGTISK